MQPLILVISNCRNSSMTYMSGLHGYGFEIEDTRTFEAARILLRAGERPVAIIIDVKFHDDEICNFIHYVRSEINPSMTIINIGHEVNLHSVFGADFRIERPANFQDIIRIVEPVR